MLQGRRSQLECQLDCVESGCGQIDSIDWTMPSVSIVRSTVPIAPCRVRKWHHRQYQLDYYEFECVEVYNCWLIDRVEMVIHRVDWTTANNNITSNPKVLSWSLCHSTRSLNMSATPFVPPIPPHMEKSTTDLNALLHQWRTSGTKLQLSSSWR